MLQKTKFGNAEEKNETCISIIDRTKIDTKYLHEKLDFRDEILEGIKPSDSVLDIGKSLRDYHEKVIADHIDTLDINDFGDYPNIIGDLCADEIPQHMQGKYDVIVCLAVLEHVYNPFKAAENLQTLLKPGGTLYGYVPYLYRYHAPEDLHFQDYFRFSKDALAYVLKDFSDVKLYPVRGLLSTSMFLLWGGRWKKYVERTGLNTWLDKLLGEQQNIKQCSGFYFVAVK